MFRNSKRAETNNFSPIIIYNTLDLELWLRQHFTPCACARGGPFHGYLNLYVSCTFPEGFSFVTRPSAFITQTQAEPLSHLRSTSDGGASQMHRPALLRQCRTPLTYMYTVPEWRSLLTLSRCSKSCRTPWGKLGIVQSIDAANCWVSGLTWVAEAYTVVSCAYIYVDLLWI